MPQVIGIGSIFADKYYRASADFLKQIHLDPEGDIVLDSPVSGLEKLLSGAEYMFDYPGGMVLNTLAVLKKLGISGTYYGVLGKDELAEYIKKECRVINRKCIYSGNTSVCACIISNKGKNRAFISVMNSKDNIFFQKSDIAFLNRSKFVHIGPFLKDPQSALEKLILLVNQLKKPRIFLTPSSVYTNMGLAKLAPLLKNISVLFINRDELKMLIDKPVKSAAKNLLGYGPEIIVCTLGSKGALITTHQKQFVSPGVKPKKIVDSTSAGDTFAAGFTYGILTGKTLESSAKFANKLAAQSLEGFGISTLKF